MRFVTLVLVLIGSANAFGHGSDVPIFKFRAVTSSVFAGANPVAPNGDLAGVDYLQSIGIRTVVSLQGADVDGSISGVVSNWIHHGERAHFTELERCAVEGRGMRFVNLPVRSRRPWGERDRNAVEDALSFLVQASPEAPLYLHCQRGIDRTGLIVALYRIRAQGWTPEAAYAEWNGLGRTRVARMVTAALDDYFCEKHLLTPIAF